MTIHGAKGLEFKVVIVADAGRDIGGPRSGDEIVALSDGRFGFKMVHPTRGDRRPVFDYEDVRKAEEGQERAERLRLYYVAMTRAIDRLIVSGAIDTERKSDRETPIGWVLERLAAAETVTEAGSEPIELERGEARFLLRVGRYEAPVAQAASRRQRARSSRSSGRSRPATRGRPRAAGDRRSGRAADPRRAPALVQRARAVRALLVPLLRRARACGSRRYRRRMEATRRGLAATEIGDAVHRLLELVPLDEPRTPGPLELAAAVRAWYPAVSDEELDRIASLVDAYCESPLARRLASLPGARPERPFSFEHDGVLLHGRLDVLWREGSRALVADYKSNVLDGADPSEVVDAEYRLQRLVYALACLRDGADEVEVVYQFLERPDDLVSATFTREEVGALEAELSSAIARIREGDFRPTPSEFACSGCPALDLVCAGPRLHQDLGPPRRGHDGPLSLRVAACVATSPCVRPYDPRQPAGAEAVLAEVAARGVGTIVCGGDVVGGPFPAEVLDRLAGLRRPLRAWERRPGGARRHGRVRHRLGRRATAARPGTARARPFVAVDD